MYHLQEKKQAGTQWPGGERGHSQADVTGNVHRKSQRTRRGLGLESGRLWVQRDADQARTGRGRLGAW